MAQMRAAAIEQFGGPEQIRMMQRPIPVFGPDQVLIKAAASGVNPVDYKIREGRMTGRFPHHFPLILGWDVAGEVEAVGPAVTSFVPGDRVVAYARKSCIEWGTYASYVAVGEEAVAIAPSTVDMAAAACLPLAALTALQMIRGIQAAPGDTVLVHGGSGGVGSFAVQLLKNVGAGVIATGSPPSHGFIRSLGGTPVDRHEDLLEQVRPLAPDGVEVMLDIAGGPEAVKASLPLIKDGGKVASLLSSPEPDAGSRARGIKGRYFFVRPAGAQLSELARMVEEGALVIHLHQSFPLEGAAEAHEMLQGGGVMGKIALKLDA